MIRGLTLSLLLVLPAALAAQEGSIAYTHSVKVEFELPEGMEEAIRTRGGRGFELPTERTTEVVLFFNGTESLMKPIPPGEGEGRAGRRGGAAGGGDRMMAIGRRMRFMSTSRADQESVVEAHTNYAEGTIVETRELLGRNFIIEKERPTYPWRLSSEQAEFQGYMVQKATAQVDSTTIEAWFTPQIPVMGGPGPYGGLPGMILVVSVNDGHTQYNATGIALGPIAEGVIVKPSEGQVVTQEEYEQIVEEKMEELRTTRGRGRVIIR